MHKKESLERKRVRMCVSPKEHKSLVYNAGLLGTRVHASELCRADE